MKSIFKSIKSLLIISVAFVAAACGGQAYAGTLVQSFVDDTGRVFQVDHVLSAERDAYSGKIIVKHLTGSLGYFSDSSGGVWAKVKPTLTADKWVQVGASERYMAINFVTEVACWPSSGVTVFSWATVGPAEFFADGCALHERVRRLSTAK